MGDIDWVYLIRIKLGRFYRVFIQDNEQDCLVEGREEEGF